MSVPKPRIKQSIEDISSKRNQELLNIFHSIALKGNKINIKQIPLRGFYTIGISDRIESGNNYPDWRFRLGNSDVSAMYYERWISLGKGNMYFLERAYFHVYKPKDGSETEFFLLHCDASDPNHLIYKTSPHLHIKCADEPFPKAHIALFNGKLTEVLANRKNFDIALSQSIAMLKEEIFKNFV